MTGEGGFCWCTAMDGGFMEQLIRSRSTPKLVGIGWTRARFTVIWPVNTQISPPRILSYTTPHPPSRSLPSTAHSRVLLTP